MVNLEQEDQEREATLLDWTKNKCSVAHARIEFEEGWSMIKKHGLDILQAMIRKFLLDVGERNYAERKPFGSKGYASLYAISYKMVTVTSMVETTDVAVVFYDRICKFIRDNLNTQSVRRVVCPTSTGASETAPSSKNNETGNSSISTTKAPPKRKGRKSKVTLATEAAATTAAAAAAEEEEEKQASIQEEDNTESIMESSTDCEVALLRLVSIWQSHKIVTKWMTRIFSHLESGVIRLKLLQPLTAVSFIHFYKEVYAKSRERLARLTLDLIHRERSGDLVDQVLLQDALQIFVAMGVADSLAAGPGAAVVVGHANSSSSSGGSSSAAGAMGGEGQGKMSAWKKELMSKLTGVDAALKIHDQTDSYREDFERVFLKETREFYAQQSALWIQQMDMQTYIQLVDAALEKEERRAVGYLHPSTKGKVVRASLETCVLAHRDRLFESFKDMLRDIFDGSTDSTSTSTSSSSSSTSAASAVGATSSTVTAPSGPVATSSSLRTIFGNLEEIPDQKATVVLQMYQFCLRTQKLNPDDEAYQLSVRMCAAFREYVAEIGERIINERKAEIARLSEQAKVTKGSSDASASDPQFISSLLVLFKVMPHLVKVVFKDDPLFVKGMRDALTEVANSGEASMGGKFSTTVMLAAYCDNVLKGTMKLTDEEQDSVLKQCLHLFSSLIEKDVFVDTHRTLLAKRLLNKRSASNEAEKNVVGAMKMQCGSQFTSKLEGMLNDFQMAQEKQREYSDRSAEWRTSQQHTNPAVYNLAFTATVLTSSFWPSQKTRRVHLPPEMAAWQTHFQEFYSETHSSRFLRWIYALGDVSMRVIIGKRDYEVTFTTIQAVVFHVFQNEARTLSFEEIQSKCGLVEETETLKRILHSLSCQKLKLLVKTTESRAVATTDKFSPNMKFVEKRKKFRLPMASLDEHENQRSTIDEDRKNVVQAVIVRTMKARKKLAHNDLTYEIMRQVEGFQPDARLIKRCVEELIEREYLERDSDDNKVYGYLA